jgi:hypothetical protein
MVWVTGPWAIAAAVLVIGGLLSLRDSRPARDVLVALGVPAAGLVAHLAAPAEIAVGGIALLKGGWLAAVPVAVAYLAFVVVLATLLRRGDRSSCGCFGRLSTRPTRLHLAVDTMLAVVAVAAVAADPPGLLDLMEQAPSMFEAGLLVGVVVLAAVLTVVVLTVLPATAEAARPDEPAVPAFAVRSTP